LNNLFSKVMKRVPLNIAAAAGILAIFICSDAGWAVHSRRVSSTARGMKSFIAAPVPDRTMVLFIIDGCRADVMYDLIESGEMPNIKKEILERGIAAENAITCIPSTTFSAITTSMTGKYPGETGIVGNRWFDPVKLESRSYLNRAGYYKVREDTDAKTIFQVLLPRETASILSPVNKGAAFIVKMDSNYIGMGNYMIGRWEYVDRVYMQHLDDVALYANKAGIFPVLTVVHMPSTDHIGHESGCISEEYKDILKNFDSLLGEAVELFTRNGEREKISIIVTADHGQVTVGESKHADIKKVLKDIGIRGSKILNVSKLHNDKGSMRWFKKKDRMNGVSYRRREKQLKRYNIIYAVNGRCAYIYIRKNRKDESGKEKFQSWDERLNLEEIENYTIAKGVDVNLINKLLENEGVGFAVFGNNGSADIYSEYGKSSVEEGIVEGRKAYKYKVIYGEDPLCMNEGPWSRLLDGNFHTVDKWLEYSNQQRYPGVITQIASLVNNPRSGDLVLFASEGWDFEPEKKNNAAHGGFEAGEMRIPFLWSGPGIRKGSIGTIRSVDIFPTIAEYLGVAKERVNEIRIDGVSFLDEVLSP